MQESLNIFMLIVFKRPELKTKEVSRDSFLYLIMYKYENLIHLGLKISQLKKLRASTAYNISSWKKFFEPADTKPHLRQ
jgi:hypothetical protein